LELARAANEWHWSRASLASNLAHLDRCLAVSSNVPVIAISRVTDKPNANSLIGLDSLSWSPPHNVIFPPPSAEIFLSINIRMGRVNLELDLAVYLSPKITDITSILI
jgi:hypothetical protein